MITVATDDDTFSIDADLSVTLENLMAILEADTSISVSSQALFCNGNLLSDPQKSLTDLGVQRDDLLLLRNKKAPRVGTSAAGNATTGAAPTTGAGQVGPSEEQAAETLRREILGNPQLMAQLRTNRPELADAVTTNPTRFVALLRQERERASSAHNQRLAAEAELAAADEFDIEAQRKIEEAIRQEQVMENLESAMEYNPESFGRVTMLYVETEVNSTPVKAFVDSGAQATIMSPECAEKCGIMRLIDHRFAGIARGVGTAKILGRVHSAQIKLGNELFLPCSFTIMEGRGVDLLFGLDMLKRHSCVLDLHQNALIVHGKTIRFLDEHELPESARMGEEPVDESGNPVSASNEGLAFHPPPSQPSTIPIGDSHGAATANANAAAKAGAGGQEPSSFPGRGNSLRRSETGGSSEQGRAMGGMSWNHPPSSASASQPGAGVSNWPTASIQSLKDLGATDAQAKALLDATSGNVEVAASLLFQQ